MPGVASLTWRSLARLAAASGSSASGERRVDVGPPVLVLAAWLLFLSALPSVLIPFPLGPTAGTATTLLLNDFERRRGTGIAPPVSCTVLVAQILAPSRIGASGTDRMPRQQTPAQRETVERVMHEFKHGELKTASRHAKGQEPETGDRDRLARSRRVEIRKPGREQAQPAPNQSEGAARRDLSRRGRRTNNHGKSANSATAAKTRKSRDGRLRPRSPCCNLVIQLETRLHNR